METENTKRVVENTKLSANRGLKNKNVSEQAKRKYTSKLPRFVRSSSFYRSNRNISKQNGKDVAGENSVSTSKRSNRIQKPAKKSNDMHKQKPSSIPRRKNTKEVPMNDNTTLKKSSDRQLFEAKNIQRVQMLINSDLCPEDRTQTSSVISSKPIPTLGQIYRPSTLIETDLFQDWFMSLNTPLNSFESNPTIQLRPSINSEETRGVKDAEIDTSYDESTLVVDRINLFQQIYKTTNENVSEWITSELECLGMDNESGYRSSSPENLRGVAEIELTQTDAPTIKSIHEIDCTNEIIKASPAISNILSRELARKDEVVTNEGKINVVVQDVKSKKPDKNFRLSKESTYIFSEMSDNDAYFPKTKELTEHDGDSRKENISYIECPSEVLQKTTNFEGCDSPKSVSSMMVTDVEIRDELSSQCTLEQMDDTSLLEVRSADDWISQCKLHGSDNIGKKGSNEIESMSQFMYHHRLKENENSGLLDSSNSRQYYHNPNCWKKQLLQQKFRTTNVKKARCKKCQRFRRYPSTRYKITKRLDSIGLRKPLWIRICRKRWNHVWKKTAERWALWSKSPSKLKKIRMMHYLQRSIIWEDAKVQTTLLVYKEIGTDTILKEQKSAANSTLLKLASEFSKISGIPETSVSKKSRVNSGPSMFHFLHNSKHKRISLNKKRDSLDNLLLNTSNVNDNKDRVSNTLNDNEIANIHYLTFEEATNTNMTFNNISNDVQSMASRIKLEVPSLLEAGTQIYIICSNAETDAVSKSLTRCANSVATVTSRHAPFYRASGTVTETRYTQAGDTNATPFHNNAGRSFNVETQAMTPRPIKISRATTIQLKKPDPPLVLGTSTSAKDVQKKNFSAQAVPLMSTFTLTKPKLLSISSAIMQNTSASISKQEIKTAGVSTNDIKITESCHGLTASGLQNCLCNRSEKPCGKELNDNLKNGSYIISHMRSDKRPINSVSFTKSIPNSTCVISNNITECTKTALLKDGTKVIKKKIFSENSFPSVDVGADIRKFQPNVMGTITTPTNKHCIIKEKLPNVYAKVDNQSELIIQTKNIAEEKCNSTLAVNTHNISNTTIIENTNHGAEKYLINDGLRFPTTSTHVEIQTHPVLIERAIDFLSNKVVVQEKSVSTSAHVNVQDTIEAIIAQTITEANKNPLVEEKCVHAEVCCEFGVQTAPLNLEQATIKPIKASSLDEKSVTTSNIDNYNKNIHKNSLEQSTSTPNKILLMEEKSVGGHVTEALDQIETELIKHTNIDYKPILNEKSVFTSIFKNVGEETQAKSLKDTGVAANNKSFIKSNTNINLQRLSNITYNDTYQLANFIGQSVLMSAYTLNQSQDDISTQTEQKNNETGTSAISTTILQPRLQVPKVAATCTERATQASTIFFNEIKETEPHRVCACAASNYDCGTNTDLTNPQRTNDWNDKIISLSRLIGQRDQSLENDSHRHPSSMPSSALNAHNWIKRCTSLQRGEYAYQSLDNYEKSVLEDLKQLSSGNIGSSLNNDKIRKNKQLIKHQDFVVSTLPGLTLSKDSLADVLPTPKIVNSISTSDVLRNDQSMVDQATSDEMNTKDVKEFTLQACPEISDKATDFPDNENRKSACVLTSHCLLPTAVPCFRRNSLEKGPKDCVLIYREPRCMIYNQQTDAAIQRRPSSKDVEVEPIETKPQIHVSVGSSTTSTKIPPNCCHKKTSGVVGEVLSPRVYKALYETTKFVFKEDIIPTQTIPSPNQQTEFRNAAINSHPLETDIKFTMAQNPEVRSATAMTNRWSTFQKSRHCVDQSTQPDNDIKTKNEDTDVTTQTHSTCRVSFVDVIGEKDCSEDCVKTHLAASCRYYSNLLTKHIGRVKENLTRHLAPPTDTYRYDGRLPNVIEACTMKPSARQEFGCQTMKLCRYCEMKKPTSYILSPASSLTDICRYDREHLKSVYYMLSAIEGRIRRLKANVVT